MKHLSFVFLLLTIFFTISLSSYAETRLSFIKLSPNYEQQGFDPFASITLENDAAQELLKYINYSYVVDEHLYTAEKSNHNEGPSFFVFLKETANQPIKSQTGLLNYDQLKIELEYYRLKTAQLELLLEKEKKGLNNNEKVCTDNSCSLEPLDSSKTNNFLALEDFSSYQAPFAQENISNVTQNQEEQKETLEVLTFGRETCPNCQTFKTYLDLHKEKNLKVIISSQEFSIDDQSAKDYLYTLTNPRGKSLPIIFIKNSTEESYKEFNSYIEAQYFLDTFIIDL